MEKILFLTQTNIDEDSRIIKQMSALANSGKTVVGLGVYSKEGTKKSNLKSKVKTSLVHIRSKYISFLPKPIVHFFSLIELIIKMFFKSIKEKPSIVHCNDTLVLPLGVLIKIFTKSKLIYDAHELESNRNGLSSFLGKLTLYVEKFLWKWVDALIVVSPSIEEWYHLNIGIKPSAVILNSPVLLDKDNSNHDYLRKLYNIPDESKIFIYIGILGNGRGIDLILNAFSKKSVKSHVVFLGYGELYNKINTYSKKYGNIHFHSAVPHEEVVSICKSADVGLCLIENVSLSDYLCLPNKLFEYSFSGIPVLASEFPDMKKIIDEYGIGFYCDLNIDSICEKIISIEENDVLHDFDLSSLYPLSWKYQEIKLLNLYSEVLKGI